MGRKKQLPILRGVTITDIGSEGNAIAKVDEMVLFVPGMIPGDVVDVRVTKKKKRYMEGVALEVVTPSPGRAKPECMHFGVCGGCRWQHLPYDKQLFYKAKQVTDNLTRIGHISVAQVDPILGSEKIYGYRNKLEFTFSERRWMTREEIGTGVDVTGPAAGPGPAPSQQAVPGPALGFHIPGIFDKVLDINECLLMSEPADAIRNEVRRYALDRKLPFYDFREHKGFLRNMIVRKSSTGEVMVVLVTTDALPEERDLLLRFLTERFPEITSLYSIVNTKRNDSISDLQPVHVAGNMFISEVMDGLRFRVGPKSFYQTNSGQAVRLYGIVKEYAQLTGRENVYDLYTGTGTIANFVARNAKEVIGIEYVEEAIADAKINSEINGIGNTRFYAGDMKNVLTAEFIAEQGRPDVVITDPPRAGMHDDVVQAILLAAPKRIVYVSCNPATQARDLNLLDTAYWVTRVQPVDMFPHTHHVENVVLLEKRD